MRFWKAIEAIAPDIQNFAAPSDSEPEEVGQLFALTRKRIRQIEAEALHKQRQPS